MHGSFIHKNQCSICRENTNFFDYLLIYYIIIFIYYIIIKHVENNQIELEYDMMKMVVIVIVKIQIHCLRMK